MIEFIILSYQYYERRLNYSILNPEIMFFGCKYIFQILSRDHVTVSVDAVVYYRVQNPLLAENNVEDYRYH